MSTQMPTGERVRVRKPAEGFCPGSAAARSNGDRVTGASRPARGRRQLPWMRDLVIGSVLAEGSGTWRVVRHLTRYSNGDLRSVDFTIRHCSWTGRCYTVVGYNDLIQRGFRMVRVKPRRLTSAMDRRIHEAIHEHAAKRPYAATCCDVEGVA